VLTSRERDDVHEMSITSGTGLSFFFVPSKVKY